MATVSFCLGPDYANANEADSYLALQNEAHAAPPPPNQIRRILEITAQGPGHFSLKKTKFTLILLRALADQNNMTKTQLLQKIDC